MISGKPKDALGGGSSVSKDTEGHERGLKST